MTTPLPDPCDVCAMRSPCEHRPAAASQAPPVDDTDEPKTSKTDERKLPAPSAPLAVARVLAKEWRHDGTATVRWWRGQWIGWHGSAWAEKEDAALRKHLYTALEHAQYLKGETKGGEEVWVPWSPSRRKVADVLDALSAILHLPETVNPPSWLSGPRAAPADRIVACENGLLDVTTRTLHTHTPRYLTLVSVPFEWRADVEEPTRWLAFLRQLWPQVPGEDGALREADEVLALQEWFGYVVSGRTDLQKILLIIGPTRSGKGTIARVLSALVGHGNAAGPTLASLATQFGLSPLLGKPLAIVADARLGRGDANQVVERLLSISGEDMQTVDRKFREPWTGKLPARFTILSNELPRFGDASGAIANRFVVLSMSTSFLGKEDAGLTGALLAELPGILRWALDGLDRLATNKTFTQPPNSAEVIVALQDLVSPVAAFVRDQCKRDIGAEVATAELWAAWKEWAEDNGHKPGSAQSFGRDLRAAAPGVRVAQPRTEDGGRERVYRGIALCKTRNGDVRVPTRANAPDDDPGDDLARVGTRANPLQLQHDTKCSMCRLPMPGPFDPDGRCRECTPASLEFT